MKIYISGQITNLSKQTYILNFENAESWILENYGSDAFRLAVNPLNIKPLFGIKKWLFFMWSDIRELRKCDAIALQPNWMQSKGAFIEHFYARFFLKIEIIEIKYKTL